MAGEQVEPVAEPDPRDKRFADPEWSTNQFFDFLKQAYLLTVQWANHLVKDAEGLDPHTRQKAEFYVRQIANAISPSNFVLTNPELLRETVTSNAENLVRGMHMLAEDIEAGHGNLKIRQSDARKFEVGAQSRAHARQGDFRERADAAHPVHAVDRDGAQAAAADRAALDQQVLHPRSHAGEILHQVVRRPGAHGVRHLLGQSGRPSRQEELRRLHARGPARRPRRDRKGDRRARGATPSAIASAARCWPPRSPIWPTCATARIASATFFAAQVDFTHAGDLKVFVDEEQIAAREREMSERGYLEGKKMANAFNLLRSNDLIWPYVINNYLKGKEPAPFDLLYWNSDATRMPAANHSFYLRNCYLENRLSKGEMVIGGKRLDLKSVTVPIYNLATREDHIAPAKSVLLGSKFFGGPVRFVLAGSGHIAGVVNPPDKMKYQYWTGPKPTSANLDRWLGKAKEHAGSWWPDWLRLAQEAGCERGAGARARRRRAQADRGRAGKLC